MNETLKKVLGGGAIVLGMLFAPPIYGAPLKGGEKNAVAARISMASQKLRSMSCSFVQTKYMAMLNDKMVAQGVMKFQQPSLLRWEYTSPYLYLFIFNGQKVYIGSKSRKDVIDTKSSKVFKEIAGIIMNTVTGKIMTSSSEFGMDIESEGGDYKVSLTPRKKELKSMFSKIVLTFDPSAGIVDEIDIYEKNRDRTNIKLNNIKQNVPINESVFAIP